MISDKSIETLLKVKGYYRVNFIRTIVAQNKIKLAKEGPDKAEEGSTAKDKTGGSMKSEMLMN